MEPQEAENKDEKAIIPEVKPQIRSPHMVYNKASIAGPHRNYNFYVEPFAEKDRIIATITGHRTELEDIGTKLSKESYKYKTIARFTKVLVIALGAFIATKGVANQILGVSNIGNIILYAVTGLLIATVTGLETAFQWEKKSTQLGTLVADCRATTRKTASDLAKLLEVKSVQNVETTRRASKILDVLDDTLKEIQEKSSDLGIDTTKYRDPS